jgi:hypothetical protein
MRERPGIARPAGLARRLLWRGFMKNTASGKKLKLSGETLRALQPRELDLAGGGMWLRTTIVLISEAESCTICTRCDLKQPTGAGEC